MESMTVLVSIGLAVFGAVLGSFAGAVAWRLYKGRDFVRDRSECEHCHHKLGWQDLLPLISWLSLGGRCRYCKRPIGQSALWVEVSLAAYFVTSYLFWPHELGTVASWLDFGLWLTAGVALAVIFVYDLRWSLMPQSILTLLIGLGVVDFGLRAITSQWTPIEIVLEAGLALMSVAGFYYVLYLASNKRWVGFGDIELGVFIGLVLGWPAALLSVFIANLAGTLVILPGLISGRIGRQTRIPFGPFLIFGFVVAGLWGQAIIDWYLRLIL